MEQWQSREKPMSRPTVVAVRGAPQQGARRILCPSDTWEFLRDLGQTFGWHPRGTTYVTSIRQNSSAPEPIRHNYQPGGMYDSKRIEAEDAVEWATALRVAKRSSYCTGMIRAHSGLVGSSEQALFSILDEFIQFAREGAFVFSLRAESDRPVSFTPMEANDHATG